MLSPIKFGPAYPEKPQPGPTWAEKLKIPFERLNIALHNATPLQSFSGLNFIA
jgi:hypothetical protein